MMNQKFKQQEQVPSAAKFSKKNLTVSNKDNHRKNASETFNVTAELVRRGYTEDQIAMMWSGNLLRVLDDVQRIAAEIQSEA